jgi:hypothetical protein
MGEPPARTSVRSPSRAATRFGTTRRPPSPGRPTSRQRASGAVLVPLGGASRMPGRRRENATLGGGFHPSPGGQDKPIDHLASHDDQVDRVVGLHRSRTAPPSSDPRLSRFLLPLLQADSAADRPGRPRRGCNRCLRRGGAEPARVPGLPRLQASADPRSPGMHPRGMHPRGPAPSQVFPIAPLEPSDFRVILA